MRGTTGERGEWFLAFLLIAATLLVNAQILSFPFLSFDDRLLIVDNEAVHSWKAVPAYFTHDQWQHSQTQTQKYYRPTLLCWLLLNFKLFGLNASGWHASQLLLEAVAVLLLWRVLLALGSSTSVAFCGAMLFGVHPVHAESVAWLAAMADPLLGVIFFGGLLAYLKWRRTRSVGALMATFVLSLAAMGTKEVGIALPVMIVLHELVFGEQDESGRRSRGLLWIAMTAAIAMYVAARVAVIHPTAQQSWFETFATAPMLAWLYLREAFWPVNLGAWYDVDVVRQLTILKFWAPLVLAIGIVALSVWAMWTRKLAGFFGAFWSMTLAASLAGVRVFEDHDIFHDRYNYLPVAAICWLIAFVIVGQDAGESRFRRLILLGLVFVFGALSMRQVGFWRSDVEVYTRAVKVSPRSMRPRNLLAGELLKVGNVRGAMELSAESLSMDPSRWENNFTYGVALMTAGRVTDSAEMMRRCIAIDDRRAIAYVVLASELQASDRAKAEQVLRSAPTNIDSPEQIAGALRTLGTQ